AHRERAIRWAMHPGERLREAVGLPVYDEVDRALAVEDHILGAMARDGREAQLLEERAQQVRIGRRVLDELEAVGARGVLEGGALAHGVPGTGKRGDRSSLRPRARNRVAK